MKKYIITIIVLSLVIVGLLFIMFIGKNNYDKDIEDANKNAKEYKSKWEKLKDKKSPTEKEFEKLSEPEKIIIYKETKKDKEEAIDLAEDILKENEKLIKNLEQCNTKLKRKDKLLINGILGVGLDQELNITGLGGGTINGKIFDGFFTKTYIGGGGVCTVRADFNTIIIGGDIIFNVIITFGK